MQNDRKGIINAITSPLGFFALALLITEGFIGIILGMSKNSILNLLGISIGAFLFLFTVFLVWLLVWSRPANLTLEGKHHLEIARMKNSVQFNREPKNITEENIKNIFKNYLDKNYD